MEISLELLTLGIIIILFCFYLLWKITKFLLGRKHSKRVQSIRANYKQKIEEKNSEIDKISEELDKSIKQISFYHRISPSLRLLISTPRSSQFKSERYYRNRERRLHQGERFTQYSNYMDEAYLLMGCDFMSIYEYFINFEGSDEHIFMGWYGEDILDELLDMGAVRFAELTSSFKYLEHEIATKIISSDEIIIYDYGGEQTIGTRVFYEFIRQKKFNLKIDKIVLIDTNHKAVRRGVYHINKYIDNLEYSGTSFEFVFKKLGQLTDNDLFLGAETPIRFHFLTNVFEKEQSELSKLSQTIISSSRRVNYVICIEKVSAKDKILNFTSSFSPYDFELLHSSILDVESRMLDKKTKERILGKSSMFHSIFKFDGLDLPY